MPKKRSKQEDTDYEDFDLSDEDETPKVPKLPPLSPEATAAKKPQVRFEDQVKQPMEPTTEDDIMMPLISYEDLQNRDQQCHAEMRSFEFPEGYLNSFVMEQGKGPEDYEIERSLVDNKIVQIRSPSLFSPDYLESLFCGERNRRGQMEYTEVQQENPVELNVSEADKYYSAMQEQLKSFLGNSRETLEPQVKMSIQFPHAVKAKCSKWKMVFKDGEFMYFILTAACFHEYQLTTFTTTQ